MPSRRKGFTLVELLVVIAITGILIAMLLPAVQAAREAARRSSCSNNLKQVGLALHIRHNTHGRLPAGWEGYDSSGRALALGSPGWGWAARVLPFLEQANVEKNLIDYKLPVTDPANAQARLYMVRMYRCPSDTGGDTFVNKDEQSGSGTLEFATANYVGVFGTTDTHVCGTLPTGTQCTGDGSFFHNSAIRFADVTDGLSQTFLVGERNSRLDYSTWVGTYDINDCSQGRIVGTATYPPNSPAADLHNFSSEHPSGTHFLVADGSVRLISQTIDTAAYHALCTRAGSDSVGNHLSP